MKKTYKAEVKNNKIISKVVLYSENDYYMGLALWDTGATHTTISKRAAEHLNLKPVSSGIAITASGKQASAIVRLDLSIDDRIDFHDIDMGVNEIIETIDLDVIIGMNVISRGDFHIKSSKDKVIFTFKY